MVIYTVNPGDSIYRISRRYGVPVDTIVNANQLSNPNSLAVGQAIVVPTDTSYYTVRRGDTMYSIARNFGIPLNELIAANPNLDPNWIQIGQLIIIPLIPTDRRAIYVNGYVYPTVSAEVLNRTNPYLSFLSIFSYQVNPDGSLLMIDDSGPIQAARAAGTGPLMVITNTVEGEGFSSETAHEVLANLQTQATLIENIAVVLDEKDYYGLNVDFEYIYPEDRQNYNNFISRLVNRLRPMGYSISVAVAPKINATQSGLLYEAHDYPALGALADFVIIMTYEWGYTYGPARAVAPINEVQRVLDYATAVIPSQKILMGMPNYGYDWTLPFVRGTAARSISNNQAVQLAVDVGANIQFHSVSQAPFFNYYDSSGRRHEVWFDDARSIAARLRLVDIYNLGGVSYWTTNTYFAQNWLVLDSMYDVIKPL